MQISVRSYLTAGLAFTTAGAIALAPLAIPQSPPAVTIPHVAVPDIRLTVTPADIETFVAALQEVLDEATATVAAVAGIPGQTVVSVVNGIVALINTVFTGLIDATDSETLVALLTVLRTLSSDAFAKLAENVGLANPVITATTTQVGELVTSAVTGTLQSVLIAVVNVVNDPLSFANYAGLLTAGVAGGQLLAGNGLAAVQAVGDAGYTLTGIALSEVTFQLNNLGAGFNAFLDELGAASGSPLVESVIAAVQGLAVAPGLAVVNAASGVTATVLASGNAAFGVVVGGLSEVMESTGTALRSAITAIGAAPLDPASYVTALAALTVGGFDALDTTVQTIGGLAHLPLDFISGLGTTAATVFTALNTAVAESVSRVFDALALPADVVALPLGIAAGLDDVVAGLAAALDDGLTAAGAVIDRGVSVVLDISAGAETAVLDALGDPQIPVVAAAPETTQRSAPATAALTVGDGQPDPDPALDAPTAAAATKGAPQVGDVTQNPDDTEAPQDETVPEGDDDEAADAVSDDRTADAVSDDEATDGSTAPDDPADTPDTPDEPDHDDKEAAAPAA
ncbi:hypothetical protein [Mycolicibacterium sp.]|uniref:hypothetical protein n=1 Tax=Mycolicibacterium sp. TaxID=2320850 RepID=UPI003D1388B8